MLDDAEALRSEDRFRLILDTAPDAIVVVGRDGLISLVNLQTEKIFGYARAELLGKPLDVLIPERFRRAHADHVRRYFAHPGARPMGSGLELFGRRADGSEMPIEVSLSPVPTAEGTLVSAAIRDITERKRIAATARLNAERLTSAVESIRDAFALYDADRRLVLCNSAFRSLVGESAGGALDGLRFQDLMERFSSTWVSPGANARDLSGPGDAGSQTLEIRTQDGRSLRITNSRTPEDGVVQLVNDHSDDVRRAEELREARALAEAGSAAKSEFLSSMSHELRTPLNAILGFAQLLQRDRKEPISDRQRERVSHILRGGEHLLRLIDDVLDLSRIEAGTISISVEPTDLSAVLEEVRTALTPLGQRDGIQVVVEPIAGRAIAVAVDRTRLSQILMNFGSNAIKYNRPKGSVTFRVSREGADRVRVTVIDTGIGIAASKQDKLFQPFQRAGQETGPIEGTGIGLVITKRLAEAMKGTVGFRSEEGRGSEFWVEIPIHELAPPADGAPLALSRSAQHFRGGGRRLVLYVEDNPANVTFITDLVSGFENVDLISAPTAEMGIEMARANPVDAMLLDINLPGMSGLEALRVLRATPETKHIPVIALTAAASDRDRRQGEAAGFYRYLTKPVQIDELESALESILSRRTNAPPPGD